MHRRRSSAFPVAVLVGGRFLPAIESNEDRDQPEACCRRFSSLGRAAGSAVFRPARSTARPHARLQYAWFGALKSPSASSRLFHGSALSRRFSSACWRSQKHLDEHDRDRLKFIVGKSIVQQ